MHSNATPSNTTTIVKILPLISEESRMVESKMESNKFGLIVCHLSKIMFPYLNSFSDC